MTGSFAALAAAFWLGILTSISPCPLTTNIAAVSYIGRRFTNIHSVLLSGILYTLGRMVAYLAVGILAVAGILSIPGMSHFLQRVMSLLVGPLLILVGMVLLGLISFTVSGRGISDSLKNLIDRGNIAGAGVLGFIFALSFCPVSAALFFGSLIPLAVTQNSRVILPLVYGLGTALPVLVFAVVIAMSARSVGALFGRLAVFEHWARRITGIVFIAAGFWLTLRNIFHVL